MRLSHSSELIKNSKGIPCFPFHSNIKKDISRIAVCERMRDWNSLGYHQVIFLLSEVNHSLPESLAFCGQCSPIFWSLFPKNGIEH